MPTSKVTYLGELRTRCEHLRSGDSYLTDAPIDNNGKGEAFSPTDTVATALANCMLTMMGIKARELEVSLAGAKAMVTKTMGTNPRRVVGIEVVIDLPEHVGSADRTRLERTAMTCPVHHSLHPDIDKRVEFRWGGLEAE